MIHDADHWQNKFKAWLSNYMYTNTQKGAIQIPIDTQT